MIGRAEIATSPCAIDAAQCAPAGGSSGSLAMSAIGVDGVRVCLQGRRTTLGPTPL
jgi:hypothetical protein